MVYFRVAKRMDEASNWQWSSTKLTSLNALFGFLKMYERTATEHVRIFFASSYKFLEEMLICENNGRISNSITVEQLLQQRRKIDTSAMVHLEVELAMRKSRQLIATVADRSTCSLATRPLEALPILATDDRSYDTAYTFTLPPMRQALAWAKLLAKVQNGELES